MGVNKKYSYMDWWSGKICLINAPILIMIDNDEELPIRVTWDEIVQEDIIKIKNKQKEIFNEAVTSKLKTWQDNFEKRHSNSEVPDILLNDELNMFSGILIDPMPSDHKNININGVLFDSVILASIKNYITSIKIGGDSFDFDLIHSNECLYKNSILNNDLIYAETCWRYIKWLEEFEKSVVSIAENEPQIPVQEIREPVNPRPEIFKNGQSYSLFLELKHAIVNKGTQLADYSFIFEKLKFCDQNAINRGVIHNIFINYLNETHQAHIKGTKLTRSNTKKKEAIFNEIFEKYRMLI